MNAGYRFSPLIRRMGSGRMSRRVPGDCRKTARCCRRQPGRMPRRVSVDHWRVYIRFALLQRTTGGFRTFSELVAVNERRLFNRLRMTGGSAFVSWMDSAEKRASFRQSFRFGRKTRKNPPVILGVHNYLHFNWKDMWMPVSGCALKARLKAPQETSVGLRLGSMHAPRLPHRRLTLGARTLRGGSPQSCRRHMRQQGRDRWEDGPRH